MATAGKLYTEERMTGSIASDTPFLQGSMAGAANAGAAFVDKTLTKSGTAADAKEVGDRLQKMNTAIDGKQPKGDYALKSEIPSIPDVPVKSVNNKTGDVQLSASDVGARPSTWTPSAEDVGADARGTADKKVSEHNTSDASHNDIRLLITGLTTRLNAVANSTDTDLDQLAEIVAYIKANKSLIDSITTSKVNVADIIDNLTTSVSNKPLSAKMGVELKKLIDAIKIPTTLPASDVYDWAKQPQKPTYTAGEVGAASAEKVTELSEAIADLGGGKSVVDNAIGTTYPPSQRDADSRIDGSDIHMDLYLDGDSNLMPTDGATSDDIHTYIDTVTDKLKTRVTKELLGKDQSGNFDMMRYTVCDRQHIAWVRENYPKMYAWKNGDTTMYTESVSPRIGDNAYENPYVSASGESIETVNVPAKAVIIRGQRYSHSGQSWNAESNCSALVVPTEFAVGHISQTLKLTNATFHHQRTGFYISDDAVTFPRNGAKTNSDNNTVCTISTSGSVDYGEKFGVCFLSFDGSETYENTTLTIDGVNVEIIVTDNTEDSAKAAHATTEEVEVEVEVEVEGALPKITAVSATRKSRTINGAEFERHENGDVEPTLIYTDVDDDRNTSETITKGGITYIRYPLGDLLANKKKPVPIFVYANEHGVRSKEKVGTGAWETKLCALVAARIARDFGLKKQSQNPLYKYILDNCMLIVIPVVNPYGFNHYLTDATMGEYDGYCNSTGCNINRNYDCPGWDVMNPSGTYTEFGAYAGSENETQYVMNTMVESGAVVAMSLHGLGGFIGYCAHQGQQPDGSDYNREKLAKVYNILFDTYGIKLRYYDVVGGGSLDPILPPPNTPDKTSKSPSYITQCGAYGGIVEFQPVKAGGVMGEHSMEQVVVETAYCQTLNLMAMWLSDYLDSQQ